MQYVICNMLYAICYLLNTILLIENKYINTIERIEKNRKE